MASFPFPLFPSFPQTPRHLEGKSGEHLDLDFANLHETMPANASAARGRRTAPIMLIAVVILLWLLIPQPRRGKQSDRIPFSHVVVEE